MRYFVYFKIGRVSKPVPILFMNGTYPNPFPKREIKEMEGGADTEFSNSNPSHQSWPRDAAHMGGTFLERGHASEC